jgi:hypothetical protein
MSVDARAVADMAHLIAAFSSAGEHESILVEDAEGQGIADGITARPAGDLDGEPIGRSVITDPNIDAMRVILERMNTAGDGMILKSDVREALQTERTATGARVGTWEIVVHDSDPKTYDVVHCTTREPIAKGLYLYEAAYGLVKRLNEGVAINDKPVRDLLRLEEDYARNRNDAALYRRRTKSLREKGEDVRAAVAEDRYDDASRRAIEARERILRLAGLR